MKRVKWRDPMDQDLSGGRRHQREVRNRRFGWFEVVDVDVDEEDADEDVDFRAWDVDWVDPDDPDRDLWRRRAGIA